MLETKSQTFQGLFSLKDIVRGHAAVAGGNLHLFWWWDSNCPLGLLTFEYFSVPGVLALNNACFIFHHFI